MFMSKKIADMYLNTTQDKLESDYMAKIAERALMYFEQIFLLNSLKNSPNVLQM